MNANSFAQLTHTLQQSDKPFDAVLNIAFAVDQNYLKPCGVCINSILMHNPNINIKFHILTDTYIDFGFNQLVKKYANISIDIYKVHVDIFKEFQTNSRFPTAMYFRLILPNIFQDKVKKFIYLDADILCLNSISEILDVTLDDYAAAVVQDEGCTDIHSNNIGLKNTKRYFNSGFLYINTENWLKENVLDNFFKLINTRKFNFPDQDVLNIILADKVLYLDAKFNDTHQKSTSPIFMHFTSSPKPWSIAADRSELYMHYYNQSPWFGMALDLPTNYRDSKKLSLKFYKEQSFLLALYWFLIYAYRRMLK